MGLGTTHNAFHGGYGYFMRFREALMQAIGGPPLRTMEGFNESSGALHSSWEPWLDHDLYPLLNHSDCDGFLTPSECARVAQGLNKVIASKKLNKEFEDAAFQFMTGCLDAARCEEELEFG